MCYSYFMKDAEKSLFAMIEILNKNQVEFSIGGTGLLYFLGLYDKVGDWDILTNAKFSKIEKCLEGLKYTKVSVKHPFYSNFLYQVDLNGFEFDIMGDFKYEVEGDLVSMTSSPYMWKEEIPLANPSEWQSFYERINRESKKDSKKSELLKEWLKK